MVSSFLDSPFSVSINVVISAFTYLSLLLGFNVDTPLKGGWTGLLYACNHGNSDVVHLLLEHGANPNTQKGNRERGGKEEGRENWREGRRDGERERKRVLT